MRTFIFGASGELGAAISRKLAANGHDLILHGFSNEAKLAELADDLSVADVVIADVRDPRKIEEAIQSANSRGTLTGMVYCVGINPSSLSVAETPIDTWNDTITVNLTGAFVSVKTAVPILRRSAANAPGSIVLVSSIFGINGPANRGAYSVSKHGLTGLVQSVAKEEGDALRINAVAPGPMWSENVRRIFASHAKTVGISVEEYVKERASKIPFGRFLEPDECASVVRFLLSDEATFLTGEVFRVSGGEF